MKTYTGTKIVTAKPMNRADYNKYRNWVLPDNEEGSDDGYLVEYTDGGKANDSRHAGYISWSPKAQFDAAYIDIGDVSALPAHMQRVVAEKAELDAKISALTKFMTTLFWSSLLNSEQRLLRAQAVHMDGYSGVLGERISAFHAPSTN